MCRHSHVQWAPLSLGGAPGWTQHAWHACKFSLTSAELQTIWIILWVYNSDQHFLCALLKALSMQSNRQDCHCSKGEIILSPHCIFYCGKPRRTIQELYRKEWRSGFMLLPSDTRDINIYVCYKAAAPFRAFALLETRQERKAFKENQSTVL